MTRINVVPPTELTGKHLVAEYRELPRVFALARPLTTKETIPHYTLGKGHVLFFYDKLHYCLKRQYLIVDEMRRRGFNPQFHPITLFTEYSRTKQHLWNDYTPTPEALAINRQRINERLNK